METGEVSSTQRDVGSGLRLATSKATLVGSWGRSSNIEYTSDVLEMRAIENMDSIKILLHFLRNDLPNSQIRICLTGMIHGLLAVAAKQDDLFPLLIDLVASYDQEQGSTSQDFDKSRGSVDIGPSIEIARKKMIHTLSHYTTIFLDRQEVFKEFLKHISDQGDWIAHELNDSEMQEIDPKFESIREDQGTGSYAHILLLRNGVTGDTILVYAVWQMASSIGSPQNINCVGNSFVRTFHAMAGLFERIAGAKEENTVFGPITSFRDLPFRQILVKEQTPQYLEKICEILNDDKTTAPTVNQVAGMLSHATDEGYKPGEHRMKNGEMSMPTLERVTKAGIASHATDEGCDPEKHLMKDGKMSMPSSDCPAEGGKAGAGIPRTGGVESKIVVIEDKKANKIYYSTTNAPMCEKMVKLKAFGSEFTAKDIMPRLKAYASEVGAFKLKPGTKGRGKKSDRGACGRDMPANLDLWLSVPSKVSVGDNVTKLGKEAKRKRAEHEG